MPALRDEHLVVVGGGFSGGLFAVNVVRAERPSVTLVERRFEELARGACLWSCPPRSAAQCARRRHACVSGRARSFMHWLGRGGNARAQFVRRRLYGISLRELLDEAVERHADRLRIVVGEAQDVIPTENGYDIEVEGAGSVSASSLVLALGNLPPHGIACTPGRRARCTVSHIRSLA